MGAHETPSSRCATGGRQWSVGNNVLCPHQGIGTVVDRSVRTALGRRAEYLTIRVEQSHTDITLPTTGSAYEALRPLPSAEEVRDALDVIAGDAVQLGGTWSSRVKLGRSKLFSGELNELAEVVRDLASQARRKPLSTSERDLHHAAIDRFTSKVMYALDLDAEDARELMETALFNQPSAV